MRSVQSSNYRIFHHDGSGECVIDSKTRKSCKKCRFDKCLEAGMKVTFVQLEKSSKTFFYHYSASP